MSRRAFPSWRCAGCRRHHPVTVWIEGENASGKWCLRGIRAATSEHRNDVPWHPEVHGFARPYPLTQEG